MAERDAPSDHILLFEKCSYWFAFLLLFFLAGGYLEWGRVIASHSKQEGGRRVGRLVGSR